MIPVELVPGAPSWLYEAIGWQERLERRPTDYGLPQVNSKPSDWGTFTDWERSPEHLAAKYF